MLRVASAVPSRALIRVRRTRDEGRKAPEGESDDSRMVDSSVSHDEELALCCSCMARIWSSWRAWARLEMICRATCCFFSAADSCSTLRRASPSWVDVVRRVPCRESMDACLELSSWWKEELVSLRRCVMASVIVSKLTAWT